VNEGRNFFQDACRASPIGIAVEDMEGQPLFVNRALCSMLGFSEEEMLSKHCVDFSPPEDAEKDWALFQQLRAGAIDHYHLDKRYFRKDGSLIWGHLSISVFDRGPSPLVVALVEDITERKQFEKSLLWRLDFERLISDLSTTFISLPENDVDANIEAGLARVGKFLGMSRITIFEFLPDHLQLAPSYAWRDPEVGVAPPTVNTSSLPWWRGQILSGHISLISQLSDMPEEASAEKEYFRQRGVVSAASIPLRVSGGITGAIAFVNVTHPVSWKEDLVSQLKVIGDIFCNALKRKRVTEALSTVSQKLIEAQEQERRIIARELHDDVNQRIALAAIRLDGLRQNAARSAQPLRNGLEEIQTALTELSSDVQTLSHRLHSSKLEQLGLHRAAQSFCREFSRQHGVKIDFSSENVPRDLPAEMGLCLFRILQESLQNAAKHSGSQDLRVSLTRRSDDLQLMVSDLGKGFDPDKAVKAEGIGLASMKERMKLVNGELSVRTQCNHGTTIFARVPLKPSALSTGADNAHKFNSERDSLESIAPKSAGFSETRGTVEHKRHA
jgi:PAS domain S-box-containing protein